MPSGGARANAGRREKPKIPLDAKKGIATTVLAMDGPPLDHQRKCACLVCSAGKNKRECECVELNGEKLVCSFCKIRAEHLICRCEVCGWWEALTGTDRRLRFDTRRYLTDRRDGKPAQGVFVGDTREGAPALERGNLPSYFEASRNAAGPHKPN